MKKIFILFFAIVFFMSLGTRAFAFSGSGAGTSVNPYQITTCTQLQETSSGLASYYILKNNIDCSATTGWNGGAGFSPIGAYFIGNFDGKGYKITNLYINRPATNSVGLFANVGAFGPTAGTVKNVGLENVNITGYDSVGGISGYFIAGEISAVYVTGSVLGNDIWVGGLVGQTHNEYSPALLDSFSRASVTGYDRVGGAVGKSFGVIVNTYSTGVVTGTGGSDIGGFAGLSGATFTNDFWDTETSGKVTSAGGTGKTTAGMKAVSTFVNYNFDKIWAIDLTGSINNGYPYLNVFNGWTTTYTLETLSGTGISTDPYIITTCNQLQNMKNNLSSYFVLANNIDCSTYSYAGDWNGFLPIGLTSAAPFIGTFDGMNYKITGLYVNRPNTDYAGLFGFVGNSAGGTGVIINVGLENIDITGKASVGGITGRLQKGTLSTSYTTGKVYSTGSSVGGLVGYMGLDGYTTQISNSFSKTTAIGNNFAGGAVGQAGATATLLNVYSTGAALATGVAGSCGGLVADASSGTYTNTFWDTQASGNATSVRGTGKTTAQMQTQSTFTSWDFNTTWVMTTYPYLKAMTRTLTYTAGSHGSITGTTPQTVAIGGNGTLVTAVPDTNYHFVSWSDGALTVSRTDLNITVNISATATFAIDTHTLTYTAGSHGSITGAAIQTIGYGSNGTEVTATPDTNYRFVQWSDNSTLATRTDTNITADTIFTAEFVVAQKTLTYTAGSHGSITGTTPQTVIIGGNGSEVTATPATGYHFVSWSDGVQTASRTDMGVIDNISVTASFAIDTHTLTYTPGVHGTISGSLTQTINYGSNGTLVTAVPDTNYHFVKWSDDSTSASRTDNNITGDVSFIAEFVIDQKTLVYIAGDHGSIIGTTIQTVTYGSNGTEVTATPATGYHFVSWSDGVLTASRTDLNITNSISVTASFAIDTHTLTYTSGAHGIISGLSTQTIDYGSNGTEVTATASLNYHFVSWSDGVLTANRTDLNVTANISVTASFAIDTYTLTYRAGNNGSITGTAVQTIDYGSNGTEVTATPAAGYYFVQWSDNDSTVATRTDTNVTANINPVASFAENQVSPGGSGSYSGGSSYNNYTINALAGTNGSISPNGSTSINYGGNQTYTIIPSAGYEVADVLVDGISKGAVTTYTFANVNVNHTILVTFSSIIGSRVLTQSEIVSYVSGVLGGLNKFLLQNLAVIKTSNNRKEIVQVIQQCLSILANLLRTVSE